MTRKEAKRLTRLRLLEAARQIVLAGDEQAIAASAVARAAGVANATFYEHFANMDELLRTIAEELFSKLREELRGPRWEAIQAPNNEEKLRRQFRVPLEVLAANPRLFRLALGESSLRLAGSTRRDVVQELIDRGYPASTAADMRRLEMIADVNIAAIEALSLGHLSGRYPSLEEIVDVLVLVSRGTRLVRETAQRQAAQRRASVDA